jgi:uncharacterized membrane protein
MNWLIGFVLLAVFALIGAIESWFLGAVVGFFIGWLLMAVNKLRTRMSNAEAELLQAREAFRNILVERDRLKQQFGVGQVAPAPAPTPTETRVPSVTPAAVTPAAPVQTSAQAPAPVVPPPVPSRPVQEAAPNPNRAVFTADNAAASAQPPEAQVPPSSAQPVPPRVPQQQAPTPRAANMPPREPDIIERAIGGVKRWFTEGNVPVKLGIIVLFFGVAALLRYAYNQGVFTFPIEYRFIAVAVAALAGLGWGFKERTRNPTFGLSMQGGAIGILMLTIFGAFKYIDLDARFAFTLIVILVAASAFLAVLQNAMWIAVLGLLGGYLAPIQLSTGSGNHIALFSYYAVLNAAVFFIAWKKSWRVLNLMGFVFTFGVGTLWGAKYYVPEKFNTVEPFLILFFVFYTLIGLMYVIKQTEHRRPWIDGTLVFGTPLLAFPLQAYLLADNKMALAFSALVIALIYAALVVFLHRRKNERLLAEAYGALALGFATLAVPLAFSAATTATVWALEGVGVAWLGMRQNRKLPIIAGLLLQILAAGAYVISMANNSLSELRDAYTLVLNPAYLGAFILAISGFLMSYIFKAYRNDKVMPVLLFIWACVWWFVGGLSDMEVASKTIGAWPYVVLYGAVTMLISTLLMRRFKWQEMRILAALCVCAAPVLVVWAAAKYTTPFTLETGLYWALWAIASLYFLWRESRIADKANTAVAAITHLVWLWSIVLAVYIQWQHQLQSVWELKQGWYVTALWLPLGLLTMALWKKPQLAAWPMQPHFERYKNGWFIPAFLVLGFGWFIGLFMQGDPSPLPYVPLLNPLELSLIAVSLMAMYYIREEIKVMAPVLKLWPFAAFVFITMITLRTVHYWSGEPWSPEILDSGVTQAALTIVWSLIGVSALILGSRRLDVKQWLAGGALMLVVLAKLALVDRMYMGNIPGIVSCIAVGMLLVAVGYFAPRPPKNDRDSLKVGSA